jgi:hypothetical protein
MFHHCHPNALPHLLFPLALFLATTGSVHSQCVEPSAGLVGWWTGDLDPTNLVGDSDGTLQGSAVIADGMVGRAFEFDGQGYVHISHSATLDPGSGSFTIEGWVRTTVASGIQAVFSKYECGQVCVSCASSSYYSVYILDGVLEGGFRDSSVSCGDGALIAASGINVADGAFHHVALIRDMTEAQIELYLDGILVSAVPLDWRASGYIGDDDGDPDPLIIGGRIEGGTYTVVDRLVGSVDELATHARALAPSEVAEIHAAAQAGRCKGGIVTPCRTVSWWSGDETATDAIGPNDGSLEGAVSFAPGRIGQGFALSGGFVRIPHHASLDPSSGSFTLEAWIKTEVTSGFAMIASKYECGQYCIGCGSTSTYSLYVLDGVLTASVRGSGTGCAAGQYIYSPAPVADGEFHHVGVVRDIAESELRLYLDGVAVAVAPLAWDAKGVIGDDDGDPDPLIIGGFMLGGTYSVVHPFIGIIDELTLYGAALTDADFAEIATMGFADACKGSPDLEPPTAVAGHDASIHVGSVVHLDGSQSFDNTTAGPDLDFAWTLVLTPAASSAQIIDSTTAYAQFVADLPGEYRVGLEVTDEAGNVSTQDEVVITSSNGAPTARPGDDRIEHVNASILLDGSASSDPDLDLLIHDWSIVSGPEGHSALLGDPGESMTTFVGNLPGVYLVQLIVNDGHASSDPAFLTLTLITAADGAKNRIGDGSVLIGTLPNEDFDASGHRHYFQTRFREIISLIDAVGAADLIEKTLERTDGCTERGSPDPKGVGRASAADYIVDCSAQGSLYSLLNEALFLIEM